MQLFYNANLSAASNSITFDKEESRHIAKVLRKKTNDTIAITNGKGELFKSKLIHVDIKQCVAEVIEIHQQKKRNYNLHLAVAPTKMNDRYEWFLEKATEIGVDTITPILCAHSERKIIKLDRFNKILQVAIKQSLNTFLPKLNPLISFQEFVQHHKASKKFIAHCEESTKKSLKRALTVDQDVIILIGPEGDFNKEEINLAIQNNFIPVSLGQTRLRTETAAIVACHSVAYHFEN